MPERPGKGSFPNIYHLFNLLWIGRIMNEDSWIRKRRSGFLGALDSMTMDREHRISLYGLRPGNNPLSWIRVLLTLMPLGVSCGYAEPPATDPVTIVAEVKSDIFSYVFENRGERAILGIRIPQHGTYFYIVPDGWEKEIEGEMLHIWTDKLSRSIRPGGTGRFSMRVSSYGAVLGKGQVTVELDGGQTLTVSDIPIPVREPIGYVWLVAACILVIVSAHAAGSWLLGRRARSRPAASATVSDPAHDSRR